MRPSDPVVLSKWTVLQCGPDFSLIIQDRHPKYLSCFERKRKKEREREKSI